MEQRSHEWRMARVGDVTASRFADVLTEYGGATPYSVVRPSPGLKAWFIAEDGMPVGAPMNMRKIADEQLRELNATYRAVRLSATAESYLDELVAELLTGLPIIKAETKAMRWGTDWEAEARERAIPVIQAKFGDELQLPIGDHAYITHQTEDSIGCSPDGLVGEGGLAEIKCPYNSANHLRCLRDSGYFLNRHKPQIQGSLWVTGALRYYLISYDHRFSEYALWIGHTDRDEAYIDELATKVCRFRDKVLETYRQITGAPF